jgi:ribosomal protein L21
VGAIYAVIESGGKQYRVAEGQSLDLELLHIPDGDTVEIDRVLLIQPDSGTVQVGKPYVPGARVVASVHEVQAQSALSQEDRAPAEVHAGPDHQYPGRRLALSPGQPSPQPSPKGRGHEESERGFEEPWHIKKA